MTINYVTIKYGYAYVTYHRCEQSFLISGILNEVEWEGLVIVKLNRVRPRPVNEAGWANWRPWGDLGRNVQVIENLL